MSILLLNYLVKVGILIDLQTIKIRLIFMRAKFIFSIITKKRISIKYV
jgi:hypothetical protein